MATQTTQTEIIEDQNANAFNEDPGPDENNSDEDNDITPSELELLDNAGTEEDDQLTGNELLDDTDEDGDELNEKDDLTGEDLDVPGSDTDNADESIGEEDEENNSYSLSDQDDDEEGDDPVL